MAVQRVDAPIIHSLDKGFSCSRSRPPFAIATVSALRFATTDLRLPVPLIACTVAGPRQAAR